MRHLVRVRPVCDGIAASAAIWKLQLHVLAGPEWQDLIHRHAQRHDHHIGPHAPHAHHSRGIASRLRGEKAFDFARLDDEVRRGPREAWERESALAFWRGQVGLGDRSMVDRPARHTRFTGRADADAAAVRQIDAGPDGCAEDRFASLGLERTPARTYFDSKTQTTLLRMRPAIKDVDATSTPSRFSDPRNTDRPGTDEKNSAPMPRQHRRAVRQAGDANRAAFAHFCHLPLAAMHFYSSGRSHSSFAITLESYP